MQIKRCDVYNIKRSQWAFRILYPWHHIQKQVKHGVLTWPAVQYSSTEQQYVLDNLAYVMDKLAWTTMRYVINNS